MTEILRRPSRLVLAVVLVLALLLMSECRPDDSGPGSYKPTGGDSIWHPKRPK